MYRRRQNKVIKVVIHRAGHEVGCGTEPVKQIPGRKVTNRELETLTKVSNRM